MCIVSGFDDDLVRAVRDAADIIAVAGEYTQLQRAGKSYKGLSPFRKEKTPSFTVDPEKGLYYCFSSGVGGDAIHLHMKMTGDDFPTALESLALRFGVALPEKGTRTRKGPEKDLDAALAAGQAFFAHHLSRNRFARSYLEDRVIVADLQQRFGLGYAPDQWEALLDALRSQVPLAALEAVGLIGRAEASGKLYDRFRHRLMFPIHSPAGRLVGFGGRTLGDDRAKYVNTSETAYFHKGNLLYGFHQAKRAMRDERRAVLVEGYFDVLGTLAAGVEGAVAGMGTALTPEQAKLLARFTDEVVVAYDGDEAGERAAEKALAVLMGEGLTVRRARFPDGHDPDSLRLEQGPDAVRSAIEDAEDAVWMLIARAIPPPGRRTPGDKRQAAIRIVEVLRPLRDPLLRQAYARRAAEHLGVEEGLLHGGINPELTRTVAVEASGPRTVYSAEERALVLLVSGGAVVDPEQLPRAQVFFDEECRNIYEVVFALYNETPGSLPDVAEIVSRLRERGASIDRTARFLLEEAVLDGEGSSEKSTPAENELAEILKKLEHRWWRQRQADLVHQLREAIARGDSDAVERLREEKNDLTRSLHPNATGELC